MRINRNTGLDLLARHHCLPCLLMRAVHLNRKAIYRSAICAMLICLVGGLSAQDTMQDSAVTAFRKGRWWLGLSGGINSNVVRMDSTQQGDFGNEYNLDLSGGKFIADRWLLGAIFRAQRDGSTQDPKRELELFFIGPSATFFFSNNPIGSVFWQLSPGYSRFRELNIKDQGGSDLITKVSGQGFGFLTTFGYSLAVHDVVTFNMGFTYSTNWIDATRTVDPGDIMTDESFRVGNVAFSFGFNVIL